MCNAASAGRLQHPHDELMMGATNYHAAHAQEHANQSLHSTAWGADSLNIIRSS